MDGEERPESSERPSTMLSSPPRKLGRGQMTGQSDGEHDDQTGVQAVQDADDPHLVLRIGDVQVGEDRKDKKLGAG